MVNETRERYARSQRRESGIGWGDAKCDIGQDTLRPAFTCLLDVLQVSVEHGYREEQAVDPV